MHNINFIEPSVEIKWPWNYINVNNKYNSFMSQIEECGRICYQSFDKITEKSAYKFIPHVINRKHWSVTEFGTLDINLNQKFLNNQEFCYLLDDCFIKHSKLKWDNTKDPNILLHTTLRDIYVVFDLLYKEDAFDALKMIMETLHLNRDNKEYHDNPVMIFNDIIPQLNNKKKFIKIDPTKFDNEYIRWVTKFKSNLNFTHQLVRHRKPSYLQLSRRYVRVEDNFEVINPKNIYNFSETEFESWKEQLINQLDLYKKLLKNHKAEVARTVLPSGQMTEIIVLEYLSGWKWIWDQRTSPHADVMMRNMMKLQIQLLQLEIKI